MKIEIDCSALALIVFGVLGAMFICMFDWGLLAVATEDKEAIVAEEPGELDAGLTAEAIPMCIPDMNSTCPTIEELAEARNRMPNRHRGRGL